MHVASAILILTPLVFGVAGSEITSKAGSVKRASIPGVANYDFDDAGYTYCQANTTSASTYSALPNAQLEFVQLIVRHGDRTPVWLTRHENDVQWNCDRVGEHIYLRESKAGGSTAGVVQQVIEVPQRNSRFGFAHQVWKGTCEVGELTDRGKSQHLSLGRHLREVYVDKLGFLPEEADPNLVYVRTTSVWRTKNSAESLLAGLWPNRPSDYHGRNESELVLHTYPSIIETMYDNNGACPGLSRYSQAFLRDSQYQKFLKAQGPLMAKLNGIFGITSGTPHPDWTNSWGAQLDVLMTRHCHGHPLPCSASSQRSGVRSDATCATEKDAAQALRNAHFEWTFKYRDHPLSNNFTKLAIGSFLGELRQQMKGKIDGELPNNNLKFALYSGHDTTVSPILGVFKASNRNMLWPPYASNIAFELWKRDNGSRVVRVIYNGKVLDLKQTNKWCDLEACPVNKFLEYLNKHTPSNITAECALR